MCAYNFHRATIDTISDKEAAGKNGYQAKFESQQECYEDETGTNQPFEVRFDVYCDDQDKSSKFKERGGWKTIHETGCVH